MVKIETIEKFEGEYVTVDYLDQASSCNEQVTGTIIEIDTDNNEITVDWDTGFQIVPISDIQGINIVKNPKK